MEKFLLSGTESVRKFKDMDGEVWVNVKELVDGMDNVARNTDLNRSGAIAIRGLGDALRMLALGTSEEEIVERAYRDRLV